MPIHLLVTSQKFYNEYRNGVGFASLLLDFTPNLAGSVMEKIKMVTQVDVSWDVAFIAPNADPQNFTWNLDFSNLPTFIITRPSPSFFTDGFAVGDLVDVAVWDNAAAFLYQNLPITALSPTVMVLDGTGIVTFPTAPVTVSIHGVEPQTALTYNFGLIENAETFNTLSKVSNNNQGYYGSNIGFDTGGGVRDTNFVNMIRLGIYQDWITGSMRVRFVNNPGNYVQRFEIEHEFMIVPYYLQGQLTNLQNNVIPSLLTGLNSLKYVYNAEFRTSLSNPNSGKAFIYDYSLGAVAWFNEQFNGFQNDYNILSVTYEEKITGAPASGILIGSETRIRVTVDRLSGPFVGAERFGAYISFLPSQAQYTNTTLSTLIENFIYDNALNSAGLAPVTGQDFITACSASVVAGDLEIIIDMEYGALQKAFLSQQFNIGPTRFMLAIECGDNTLPSVNSDRIMILTDVELYDQSPDIEDLMHVTKYDIYPHDKQIGIDTGYSDMTSWNEDGLVVDFEFDLNLNLSAFMNSLNFVLVAYNPITDQYWQIDSYAFSPATAVVSGGVQQIIFSGTRNYILANGDQFNDVIINVGTQAAGLQKYTGRFAQKISWQEWLANLNVDTIFFDATEPNNNFNNKASNYSLLNGYEIRLGIFSNVDGVSPLGVSGATDYLFLSPNITVYDYEKDGLVTPIWSAVIETFDAINLTPLGGSILSGIDTLFRVTWTNSGGPVVSLADIWGINRIEETQQPGYAITEMSSINAPLPPGQQLLEASVGALLDVTLVSGNVVFECLIDGSLITPGVSYNLSSRIHHASNEDPNAKLTSPDNTVKDTSGTVESKVTAP